MCLAIPGKLVSILNPEEPTFRKGKVSFDGIMKEVNLSMVPEAKVDDYVLVHVGVAISVVDEEEAQKTLEYIKMIENIDEELNCRGAEENGELREKSENEQKEMDKGQ